jgi:Protein phosphatase 2C
MPDKGPGRTTRLSSADGWQAFVASAIGADHVRAGTRTEDAVAAERLGTAGAGAFLVFAVADGHGAARHFRSDRGSTMAVAAGVAAAKAWAPGIGAAPLVSRAAASELVTDVLARWRADVAADLAADPVGHEQAALVQAGDPAEIPYGSTLLLAVVLAQVAILAQIGDGELLLIGPDGSYDAPVPGDSRLDGTHTTSLCQPDALSAFRVAHVSLTSTPVFAIFGATDGYGNAQAQENWQPAFAADLVRLAMERGTDWLGDQLQAWVALCASSNGSGDDTTAALAVSSTARLALPRGQDRTVRAEQPQEQTLRISPTPAAQPGTVIQPGTVTEPAAATRPGPTARPGAVTQRAPAARASDTTIAPVPAGPIAPVPAGPVGPAGLAEPVRADMPRRHGSRLWIAGGVLVALAVVLFLVLHSSGSPAGTGFSPSPSATPSTGTSHHASPTPSRTKKGSASSTQQSGSN